MDESIFKVFSGLKEELEKKMPTTKDKADKVRDMMAYAESYGVVIAEWTRVLSQRLADETAKAFEEIRNSEVKLIKEEKEAIVEQKTASTESELLYIRTLENLVKRRISMGQTFLKSMAQDGGTNPEHLEPEEVNLMNMV